MWLRKDAGPNPATSKVLTWKRERCWRCVNALVTFDQFVGPSDGVAETARDPMAGASSTVQGSRDYCPVEHHSDDEPFHPIVQVPPEQVLRHEKVLEDTRTTRRSRMLGSVDHHVSRLVPRSAALPVAIRLDGNGTATLAARRRLLQLLAAPTGATTFRSASRTAKVPARRLKDVLTFLASTAPHSKKLPTSRDRSTASTGVPAELRIGTSLRRQSSIHDCLK